jgi:2-dehydropantoate 2-reductase
MTEIDYLNGAIVDAARNSGTPSPINSLIVELVHDVESHGVFLTPEDVAARFGLN